MYLFVLHRLARKCTKIYNACRTIVRLIKPFVLLRFRYRCGLLRSLLLWSIKSHDVDLSVFCLFLYLRFNLNLKVIEKFQANNTVRLVIFHTANVCTIHPWKLPEIHTGIFGRMESALSFQGINVRTYGRTYVRTVTWQPNFFRSMGYQIF